MFTLQLVPASVPAFINISRRSTVLYRRALQTGGLLTFPMSLFCEGDPYLEHHASVISSRLSKYNQLLAEITQKEGSLLRFSSSFATMGINGTSVREFAPGARKVFVFGSFNEWNREQHELSRDQYGFHTGTVEIPHGSVVKLCMHLDNGSQVERVPAWINYARVSEPHTHFDGVHWTPPREAQHEWAAERPAVPAALRIYEAHVGMAGEEPRVHTYNEFTSEVLPRVARLGFNAVQLMGIMEHAYYGSFGYQVTSFFAPSSRFGTPEDLKRLIDAAHSLGLLVLLDIVHSHASSNVADGLNLYDGTDHCLFHGGAKGAHPQWGSRLFDYGNWETLRFLLSNTRYWLQEFRFDGLRFDGVTSMLYEHHGIGHAFARGYDEYFGAGCRVDEDALLYLMLANTIAAELGAVTIAEDVSGFPGTAREVQQGGLGFTYRMHMGVADRWIKLLKHERDEDWSLTDLLWVCTNRRHNERHVVYSESHDQSLVGDKTLMMWLADAQIYTHMSLLSEPSPVIERAMALHKMIVAFTWVLGGESCLVFIGNEFGHPEWCDFPREGNGESYQHARRQWSLVDDPLLRYGQINAWTKALLAAVASSLSCGREYVTMTDEQRKVVAVARPDSVMWLFNFHPSESYPGLFVVCRASPGARFRVALCSDEEVFGGHGRVDASSVHHVDQHGNIQVYLPSRTLLVLRQIKY